MKPRFHCAPFHDRLRGRDVRRRTAQPIEIWDKNGDGGIARGEFSTGFNDAGLFDEWDTDDDEMLSPVELESGVYNAWDPDNDGALHVAEWDTAVDAWFGEDDVNLSKTAWDSDGDGAISQIEFVDPSAGPGSTRAWRRC